MTITPFKPDDLTPNEGIDKFFGDLTTLRASKRPEWGYWELTDRIRTRSEFVTKLHGVIARRADWETAADLAAAETTQERKNIRAVKDLETRKEQRLLQAGLLLKECEQSLSDEELLRLVNTYTARSITKVVEGKPSAKQPELVLALVRGDTTIEALKAQVCTDEAAKEAAIQCARGRSELQAAEAQRTAAAAAAKAQGITARDTEAYKEANTKVQNAKRDLKAVETKLAKLDQAREDRRAALIERIKELETRVAERNAFIKERDLRVNEERCRRFQYIKSLQDQIYRCTPVEVGEDDNNIKRCELSARILKSQLLTYRTNIVHFLDFHDHYEQGQQETLDRLNRELYDLLTPRYGNQTN